MFKKGYLFLHQTIHKQDIRIYNNLLSAIRQLSSKSLDNQTFSKPQRIDSNITLCRAANSHLSDSERPLVILYSWLVAKARHIHKYGHFYLDKGFDVVHVKVKPTQSLRPSKAQTVAENVLTLVSDRERCKQPILIHGFSVGAYLYAETLVKLHSNQEIYKEVGDRICGQVFDSPLDFADLTYGFPQAVTRNVELQKMMQIFIEGYLKVFYNSTTKHYLKAAVAFKENQLNIPSLCLYSHQDLIASHKLIEEVIQTFRDNGNEVYAECFPNSYHVGHMHSDAERYKRALNDFLVKIGLLQQLVAGHKGS